MHPSLPRRFTQRCSHRRHNPKLRGMAGAQRSPTPLAKRAALAVLKLGRRACALLTYAEALQIRHRKGQKGTRVQNSGRLICRWPKQAMPSLLCLT